MNIVNESQTSNINSNNVGANLDSEVNDLIHLFFEAELINGRRPVKREEITHQILPGRPRLFDNLLRLAQEKLKKEFGMEIKQLPTLPPLDVVRLSILQRRALAKRSGTLSLNSNTYTLVKSNSEDIAIYDEDTEDEKDKIDSISEVKTQHRVLGLLTLTLCIIQIREKGIPLEELIVIFKKEFGQVPEYDNLVRDVWKKQKYLRYTHIPKDEDEEDTFEEFEDASSANGPLVSWGSRAFQEFPINGLSEFLIRYFPPSKRDHISKAFQ